MKIFAGRKKGIVGLDIAPDFIRLVRLRRKKEGGFELDKFCSRETPPDAVTEGYIMNPAAVVHCIRELAQEAGCSGAECALSLSGHSSIIKRIFLPQMTTEELRESMSWEAEQYIPFDIKDVNLDFQVVNPDAGQKQMEVLLVAGKKENVQQHISAVTEAGLRPTVLGIGILEIVNLFKASYPSVDEPVAILNIGADSISIGILFKGGLCFTRDISLPGGPGLGTGDDAKRLHDEILEDVRRVFDFFAVTTSESVSISRIYLTGSSPQIQPLTALLEKRMQVKVELINPLLQVEVNEAKFKADGLKGATLAISLATRSKDDSVKQPEAKSPININLIGTDEPKPFWRRVWQSLRHLSWSGRIPFTKYRLVIRLERVI
jgi:type IV pilus assembly protein PilM